MSRWKAFAIHISISACITLILAALFLGLWYPPPYFHAAGADELMLVLVGIDLVLGPLLTLIVFRSGKRGLHLDLAVIGILQSGMLLYGLSVILASRPVFLVAAIDRFVLVSANEIDPASMARATAPEFKRLSLTGPVLVGAALPTDPHVKSDLLLSSAYGNRDIEQLPEYYQPYATQIPNMISHSLTFEDLRRRYPQSADVISGFAQGRSNLAELRWLPLVARRHDLVMILSADGQPLLALPIDPWGRL